MKNPIAQFFYVPKYGKVSEKMLTRHVLLTVVMIVFCLSSMAFAAYAYYACEVNSGNQIIQSTAYYCEITVGSTVYPEVMGGSTIEVTLPAGTHNIQIRRLEKSATTGFLVVVADDVKYHTQQVSKDDQEPFQFQLELDQERTIQLMPHWGTSSYYAGYTRGEHNEFYITDSSSTVVLNSVQNIGNPGGETNTPTNPTEPTDPSVPTEESERAYQLNETDITANVGWVTILQLIDTANNTPVTGLTWHVSEPDYISIEVLEDGVKVKGIADTVSTKGVLYGRVYCEYLGKTYTCIFRIKDPKGE